jgi:pyruvate,water dikinase
VSRTYTRSLDQLRRGDESSFGGKSASLGELLAAEIPVPPGFALSTAAYSEFAADDAVAAAIAEGVAPAIADAMRAAAMPPKALDEIARAYDTLGEPPVAVRSSAIGEDSDEATFAGQQETLLWVRGVEQVCEAVRDCWISLYSPTAIAYRARLGRDREPAMGVTVQEMVDAEVSGVMFTCNPISGDPSMVAVNASWGLGLAVVAGEVTPDDYLVSKVTREVVRAKINDKNLEYVPNQDGGGAIRRDVEDERRTARCLDEQALAALVDVAKRVERHFGNRQDIEWAIARGTSAPDGLYLLQSRPVTGIEGPKPKSAPASAIAAVMNTFGANVKRSGT